MAERADWDELWLDMAEMLAEKRSTCTVMKVGAVIVRGKHPIAMGYNGTAPGEPHCADYPGPDHAAKCIHAEENAILQCAYEGASSKGASIYTTHFPCFRCARRIVRAGISKVFYRNEFHDDPDRTLSIFARNGIQIEARPAPAGRRR